MECQAPTRQDLTGKATVLSRTGMSWRPHALLPVADPTADHAVDGDNCRNNFPTNTSYASTTRRSSWDDYRRRILELEVRGYSHESEGAADYGKRWVCELARGAEPSPR